MGFLQDLIRKNQKRGDTPLPKGKALGTPHARNLLYAHNPIYIEVSQGGVSYARGVAGLVWGGGMPYLFFLFLTGIPSDYQSYIEGRMSFLNFAIGIIFPVGFGLIGILLIAFFLWSLFGPADAVVRFDRKRRKAYRWTADGTVVESDWDALTPCINSAIGSAYGSITAYNGVYVEYDSKGDMLFTGNLAHRLQIGEQAFGREEALGALEYVRRFMEMGHEAVPAPEKLLRYRPEWWLIFDYWDVVNGWKQHYADKAKGIHPSVVHPIPWVATIITIAFFPFWLFIQCTHWLSRWTARIPKWPKEIRDMHEQDLREWEAQQKTQPAQTNAPTPKRKRTPVIRLNGEIISGGED